ncbi:transposase [Mesorhizobium sp. LNHC209A00]|nr:transposase [Mesorhizobium sp. LNHC209A00]
MVLKLLIAAAKSRLRLKRQNQLLLAGARFKDGIEVIEMKPQSAA